MVYAFDSLGYAKRLRDAGVSQEQAEAHAEAARDFVMGELVTKPDLLAVRQDMEVLRRELDTTIRQEIGNLRRDTEALSLRLTIRLGGVVAIGVAALATIIKL